MVIDYFSRIIEIAFLQSITSAHVIGKMKNIFARWGIREELVSDNGIQFTSGAFHEFAEDHLQKTGRPVHSNDSEPVIPSETFVPDADPNPPVTDKELRPHKQNACDIPAVPQSHGVTQTRSGRTIRRPKNLKDYVC